VWFPEGWLCSERDEIAKRNYRVDSLLKPEKASISIKAIELFSKYLFMTPNQAEICHLS
jgi:hypothetical protein